MQCSIINRKRIIYMGRPPKKKEDRRQSASLRLDPDVFRKLVNASRKAGTSFPADLEARLVATCDLDPKGIELVGAIASDIARIERMTGKSWHRDLTTWAAVAEMFRVGPIHEFNPDQPHEDEYVQKAFDQLEALEAKRSELIERLADVGIAAKQNPDKPTGEGAGVARLPDPTRSATKLMCHKLDDPQEQERALDVLEAIMQTDEEIRQAESAFKDETRMWFEGTRKGRQLFRDYLRQEAERRRSLGETFNILHIMEIDP